MKLFTVLLAGVAAACAAAGRPVLLGDGIGLVAPLSASLVLCTDTHGGFFTVSLPSGERRPWVSSWQPEEAGWEIREGYSYDGFVFALDSSPDKEHVVFAQGVWLPESYGVPDDMEGLRGCFVVVVCDVDGMDAVPVAIGVEVGGGPQYSFTSDSRRLVGQPFYPCKPTPDGYAELLRRGWDAPPPVPPFDFYDVETGERGAIPGLEIGDGYWKCPYSDNFRIENNWYMEHVFSSFATGGVSGSYSVPEDADGGYIRGWILPDAVLMEGNESWKVLHVDGSVENGPSIYDWDLYCWLPDGSYLFTRDGGATVLHGNVDWTTGETSDVKICPGLEAFIEESFVPLPGSQGVLIHTPAMWGDGRLFYYPLP